MELGFREEGYVKFKWMNCAIINDVMNRKLDYLFEILLAL